MTTRLPISVVIPTIGRPELLRSCVASLRACEPAPAEVIVVDQSGNDTIAVEARRDGVRLIDCQRRGIGIGTNVGLRHASNGVVAVTHDDCTVAKDWVGAAWRHAQEHPAAISTGRVLPRGDPTSVPSIKTEAMPEDFTGRIVYGALYPANMVVPRDRVLAFGGFDERDTLRLAAEDNDFCYRWLTSGEALRYEPDMLVWHENWRTHEELEKVYVVYARGQGAFYAKHLRAGDKRMIGFIAEDLRSGMRSELAALRHRRPRWADERRGILRGLPAGLLAGWLESGRLMRTASRGSGPA